jgi:hypothetical protein
MGPIQPFPIHGATISVDVEISRDLQDFLKTANAEKSKGFRQLAAVFA